MRIVRVDWQPFHIPYAGSFTTAHGSDATRQGAIIRVHSDSGAIGHGEASPLTAFGGGTLDDALAHIAQLAAALLGTTLEAGLALLDQLDDTLPGMSATACGFDTALLDLQAQAMGRPLAYLFAEHPQPSVPVNATVGARDVAAACRAAAQAKQAGFGCVKLKVGVLDSPAAELARIAAVREQLGPDVRLRIDANAAWEEDEAIDILRAAEQYRIELVEQPVADLAALARVRAASRIPIAADESVGGPAQATDVINAAAADLLVVKPMMAGGLRRACAIIKQALQAGLHAFVTSTIDAGIGVAAALHLAATLPTSLACGLATGTLLSSDLLTEPLVVHHGAMPLPSRPGLGVQLDPHSLAQYAIGPWSEVTR